LIFFSWLVIVAFAFHRKREELFNQGNNRIRLHQLLPWIQGAEEGLAKQQVHSVWKRHIKGGQKRPTFYNILISSLQIIGSAEKFQC
jgi:hypothetical protein